MKRYFVNPETGLLRTGWRILAFFALLVGLAVGGMMGVRAILGGLRRGSNLQFSILATTATVAVIIARRYLDKKTVASLGLRVDRFELLDVVFGVANSALLMACMYFTLRWLNVIHFEGFTWWRDAASTGVGFQLAAFPIVLSVLYQLTIVA